MTLIYLYDEGAVMSTSKDRKRLLPLSKRTKTRKIEVALTATQDDINILLRIAEKDNTSYNF
jgi:hypothetical protein